MKKQESNTPIEPSDQNNDSDLLFEKPKSIRTICATIAIMIGLVIASSDEYPTKILGILLIVAGVGRIIYFMIQVDKIHGEINKTQKNKDKLESEAKAELLAQTRILQVKKNNRLQENKVNIEKDIINTDNFVVGYTQSEKKIYIVDYDNNKIEKIDFFVDKLQSGGSLYSHYQCICLDTTKKKLLVVDIYGGSDLKIKNIAQHIIDCKNIQDIEMDVNETMDEYGYTDGEIQTQTETQTETNTGNMLLRAGVGGLVFGPLGAVVGGLTGSKKSASTSTGKSSESQRSRTTVIKIYSLILKTNSLNNPILIMYFSSKKEACEWETTLKILSGKYK